MDEVAREMFFVDVIEVKVSQIIVGNLLGEHVVNSDQDLVGDGDGSPFVAAPGFETIELVTQIGTFGFSCAVGSLD